MSIAQGASPGMDEIKVMYPLSLAERARVREGLEPTRWTFCYSPPVGEIPVVAGWAQSAAEPANMIRIPFRGRLYSSPGIQSRAWIPAFAGMTSFSW